MDKEIYEKHIEAALIAGVESACGKKVKHPTEDVANKVANSLNVAKEKKGEIKRVEAYPCPFCNMWHVGGIYSPK